MEIKNKSKWIEDKKELFNMMVNTKSLKDFVGVELAVDGYVNYTAIDKESNTEKEYMALHEVSGDSFSTVSPTAMDNVLMAEMVFGELTPDTPIKFVASMETSKNGRRFINLKVV